MRVSSLQRSDSLENVPELAPETVGTKSKALPDSSKKTGEAVLAIFGYKKWEKDQGQVPIIVNKADVDWPFYSIRDDQKRNNFYSIFPVLNFFTGITNIVNAIIYNPRQGFVDYDQRCDYVETKHLFKYRVCMIVAGVAELTLVGGWILHGGATLYYYATRPQQEKGALQT